MKTVLPLNVLLTCNKLLINALVPLVMSVSIAFMESAHAADGTWTALTGGNASGNWDTGANWSGGTVADGSGFTANFNTLDITADSTIHLNSARTIGGLIFGDTSTATAANWTLDNNGTPANILTLAGGTPTITVNALGTNKVATISLVLAGTQGLAKAGNGVLTLSGLNTYTGDTTIGGNIVSKLNFNTIDNAGVASALGAGSVINISGGANLVYTASTGATASTDRTINVGSGGGGFWNSNGGLGMLTFNGGFSGTSGGNLIFRGSGGDITINGLLDLGAGSLTHTEAKTLFLTNAGNSFTGNVTIASGIINANSIADSGVNSAIGAGGQITLGQNQAGVGGTGSLQFSGASGGSSNRSIVINNGAAGGAGIIENTVSGQTLTLSGTVTSTTPASASALTLQGVGNGVLSGNITGSPAMSLTKAGAGTWTVSGTNTYTGATTVSAGTLLINGDSSSATGAVAVNAGTLGGNGTIGGDVTIANATTAILAPGTLSDSTETLTLSNKNLIFSGTASQMKLDITGTAAGSFDKVTGINALTQNGDIVFDLSGSYGTASWDVLNFASKSGNFDSVTLAGSYSGTLTRSVDTWTGNVGGQAWTFEQTTGLLSVVPEPTTLALLAFSLTTVMVLRRRA